MEELCDRDRIMLWFVNIIILNNSACLDNEILLSALVAVHR